MICLAVQEDVDAVALFVEAAEELRLSPLLDEDKGHYSITFQANAVGDQRVLAAQFLTTDDMRASLVPFRRLWMEGEPSHIGYIHGVLHRHVADPADRAALSCAGAVLKDVQNTKRIGPIELPSSINDIVRIWINTVVFHSGKSARHGRYTRADFDRLLAEHGAERLEYLLHHAACSLSVCYLNYLPLARRALSAWDEERGLRPSFLPRTGTPSSSSGDVEITRGGAAYPRETPVQTLHRLLRRRSLEHVARLLEMIRLPADEAPDVISQHPSLESLVSASGRSLVHVDSAQELDQAISSDYLYDTALREPGIFALLPDGKIAFYGAAMHVLTKQFSALREMLRDG